MLSIYIDLREKPKSYFLFKMVGARHATLMVLALFPEFRFGVLVHILARPVQFSIIIYCIRETVM